MKYTLSFLFLCVAVLVAAQEPATNTVRDRVFGTQAYMSKIVQNDPAIREKVSAIERHTFNYRTLGNPDSVIVPIVFHIIGDSKISKEDIAAQLERLNTDFFTPAHPYLTDEYRYATTSVSDIKLDANGNSNDGYLHPADQGEQFAKRAAPAMIQFCLPTLDPDGKNTEGIITVSSTATTWGMDNALKITEKGGSSPWPTQQYCNIWIAPLENDLAGYAQMPGGPEETDGIVINSLFFGSANSGAQSADFKDFTLGRTLVHLMGSYLNLHELWNEDSPCADDYVDDTPVHNAPNHGSGRYKHVSTCEGNPVEMTMNLMDSGNDSTMYLFTYGQVNRMQATLAEGGPRFGLTKTPTGCAIDGGHLKQDIERSAVSPQISSMQLRILPNPNTGTFTIEIASQDLAATQIQTYLYDDLGHLVWQKTIPYSTGSTLRYPFEGQALMSGIYILKTIAGGIVQTTQVVVR
jgi:hypothetical protein